MVLEINSNWTLLGIVSAGLIKNEVCDLTDYVLYTDVSKFYGWIYAMMIESFSHNSSDIEQSNDDEDRTENRKISCDYNGVNWDFKTTCFVAKQSFEVPENGSLISYRFSGTEGQKINATAVYFELSFTVDFVPFEIFENFPKLDSIAFSKCKILIVRSNLFDRNFEQIKELRLNEDKIRFIENGAFSDLKNVEKIDLTNNKIRSINKETFAHNEKLRVVILNGNEIKLIHPEAFINQKYGIYVIMFENQCFGDEAFNVTETEDLETCYDNWKKAYAIFKEGKKKLYCTTDCLQKFNFFF